MSELNSKGWETISMPRSLTAEEEENLKLQDLRPLSDFKKQQLECDLRKNWDIFYKRNTTKFFKDRHWTTREFEELGGVNVCLGLYIKYFITCV
jgi:methyltransferase-like protein 6